MAGLLNLLADRYFQQQDAEKFQGLLSKFPTQMAGPAAPTPYDLPADQMGAPDPRSFPAAGQPGGGILADRPADFYLQAGAIPAYRQMAMQAQVGSQAMQRQQQQQQFEAQNMTMAQKATLEANNMQRQWENERRGFEWNNPSAYQQAQIGMEGQRVAQGREQTQQGWARVGLDQQRLAADQAAAAAKAQQDALAKRFPALGLTGKDAIDYRNTVSTLDSAAATATDTMDYLRTGTAADRASGKTAAMQAAFQADIVPVMAKMIGTGALQKNDQEFIAQVIGDPGAFTSLDSKEKQKVGNILQKINDERQRQYSYSGLAAPTIQPGQSSWMRSYGQAAADPGDLKPIGSSSRNAANVRGGR